MNPEIRYSEEPVPSSGMVRELMVNGKWVVPPEQRPANWRELERKMDCPPAPKVRPAHPQQQAPPHKPAPKKVERRTSLEAILEGQRQGRKLADMAAEWGVSVSALSQKVVRARKAGKDLAEWLKRPNQGCSRRKLAIRKECGVCARKKRKAGAPPFQPGDLPAGKGAPCAS